MNMMRVDTYFQQNGTTYFQEGKKNWSEAEADNEYMVTRVFPIVIKLQQGYANLMVPRMKIKWFRKENK